VATEDDISEDAAHGNPDPRTLVGVWIAMNEDGFYEVGTNEEEASTRLMES
jgi:hypothetical protein